MTSKAKVLADLASYLAIDANGMLTATNEPPQFDASSRVATMAALARALGNSASIFGVNSNTTLGPAQVGSVIQMYGSTAFTTTLPLASACPIGSVLKIFNSSSTNQVVARQSTDVINMGYNGASQASATLYPGTSLYLVAAPAGNTWYAFGGSGALPFDRIFAFNLGSAGYQRLPSGLIMQWGGNNVSGANTVNNITLPIAFPNVFLGTAASCATTGSYGGTTMVNLTTIGVWADNTGAGINWLAFGY